MIRIMTVVGARPQFIKASAISRVIREKYAGNISEIMIHTGQHYDPQMSDVFFSELQIPEPAYNLGVGSASQAVQLAEMIMGLEKLMLLEKPDMVLVYGDTNSTLAGALAASKIHIPIVHIEAGLRSFNKTMPEEINRVLCDHCSSFLFTPTSQGLKNLLNEGFIESPEGPFSSDHPYVMVSGDVMYDNSLYFSRQQNNQSFLSAHPELQASQYHLLTLHRSGTVDRPELLTSILESLYKLASADNKLLLFPVHPRTKNMLDKKLASVFPSIILTEPLSYLDMIEAEKNADMIITDSGGVQKEACFHEKKCLVIRNETEWTELAEHGMLIVAGTEPEIIGKRYSELKDRIIHEFPKPYGDGRACELILESLIREFPQ